MDRYKLTSNRKVFFGKATYFTVAVSPFVLKKSSVAFFMNAPIAGNFLFPLASVCEK
jgi:hypothetical protein